MRIDRLELQNFRIFQTLDLSLSPGVVAIVGPNASGKTTVLEAIFLSSAGRSPRTHRDADLVRWGQRVARVEAMFRRGDGRTLPVRAVIELLPSGLRKRVWLGDKPVRRAAELLATIPVVLFTPADLRLAQGEPSLRRRFMNLALARLRPAYASDLAQYRRAVLQRNRLLREAADPHEIAAWTSRVVEAGSRVAAHRHWFAQAIGPVAADLHSHLSGDREKLGVEYTGDLASCGGDTETAARVLRELLQERRTEELKLGRTLAGPHRDDLSLTVNGRPLRTFGSQGQQRTAALALKLAEAELLWRTSGESPVLLLDDCFSELDRRRAVAVLDLTERYEQLIVTSASDDDLLAEHGQLVQLHQVGRQAEAIRGEG